MKNLITLLCIFAVYFVPVDAVHAQAPVSVGEDCPVDQPEGVVAAIGEELIPEEQLSQWVGSKREDLKIERIKGRINLLQIAVQDRLFRQEAKSQGLSQEDFISAAIHRQVKEPTEEDLLREFRSSPDLYGSEIDRVREEVRSTVLRKKTAERGRKLLEEIQTRIPVEMILESLREEVLDLGLEDTLAVVGEDTIRVIDIEQSLEDLEHELDWRRYEIEVTELNLRINDRLLRQECQQRELQPHEILKLEVVERLQPVTDEDVDRFFEMNRSRIVGELEDVRESIRAHLLDERRFVLEARFAERMRNAADVIIYLKEPQPPVHIIETEGRVRLGSDSAPIKIVEFVDFQCERCQELWGFLKKVQELHAEKVQVVVCNQPLGSIHPQAMNAALAAEAANLQGKYWQMADALFAGQSDLSTTRIEAIADEVGLDLDRFKKDRFSQRLVMKVTADLEEGKRLGIDRTPVIYLNGRKLEDKSWEGILQGVQKEILRLGL